VTKVFNCQQSYLKNADGSSLLTEGETAVLAGVYGPADIRESRQNTSHAVLDVNFRPKVGMPSLGEKYLEQFVRGVLKSAIVIEDHPRTGFYVITQIMEDCGSLLACSINASVLALQDAGVSLKFIPVAVSVAIVKCVDVMSKEKSLKTVVSPSKEEENDAAALMTFTFNSVTHDLVSCQEQGSTTPEQYEQCLEIAHVSCLEKLKLFRAVISKKYSVAGQ